MVEVKGTKLYPLKVVEYRPVARFFKGVLTVLFVSGAIAAAFYGGYLQGMAGQEKAITDVKELTASLVVRDARIGELEQQVANLQLGSQVDKQASEGVRQEVIGLKDELAKLQEENGFYRNLMAPTGNKRGLTFGNFEIVDTDTSRVYSYKLVMQQLATNHILLKGSVAFTVLGRQGGAEASYTLSQLSDDVKSDTVRLRFKYFQTIEGKLTLPEGFDPEAILLVAKSTGKDAVTVEKRFGWLVEES